MGEVLRLYQEIPWGDDPSRSMSSRQSPSLVSACTSKPGVARRTRHVQPMLGEVPILRDEIGYPWCRRAPLPKQVLLAYPHWAAQGVEV